MQEKKGGIPEQKYSGKGKTVTAGKNVTGDSKNKKREKTYDIWKVY